MKIIFKNPAIGVIGIFDNAFMNDITIEPRFTGFYGTHLVIDIGLKPYYDDYWVEITNEEYELLHKEYCKIKHLMDTQDITVTTLFNRKYYEKKNSKTKI